MVKDDQIIIIGAAGQLGQALHERYPGATAVDRDQLDITDWSAIDQFDWSPIKLIINAAAMTNVDGAETSDGRVLAWQVNAAAVAHLVRIANQIGATLVHYSTDYVFDGSQAAHQETEPFSPLSVYGQSKAAGDTAVSTYPNHYLLRTSWVIGAGKNFVRTMLNLAAKGVSPAVVNDQTGRPTFTSQLVDATSHLLETAAAFGTYNVSNDGPVVSWAELARATFKAGSYSHLTVTDISTATYAADHPGMAPRPAHSDFDLAKIKATGLQLRDWSADLARYIKLNSE